MKFDTPSFTPADDQQCRRFDVIESRHHASSDVRRGGTTAMTVAP